MSPPGPLDVPNDPPPLFPSSPGPPSPPKGKFRKLFQNIRAVLRSLRMSSELRDKVVDAAKALTELAADVADNTGVPGVAVGIGVLDKVLEKLQTMSANMKDVKSLEEQIRRLKADMLAFESPQSDQPLPENMQQSIGNLIKTWADIGQSAQHIAERGRFKRFMTSGADADELEDLIGQISSSIEEFLVHAVLNIGRNVQEVQETVIVKAEEVKLEVSFISMYAKRAQYNASSVRRPCLPGTRKVTLDDIIDWVFSPATQDDGSETKVGIVYWVCGLAGTGKTTIAVSVAEQCKILGILGASFFCSLQDAECRDPNLIFVTICRQLCQFHAPFKAEVAKVIEEDPSVLLSSPAVQFERLILKPLEALKDAFPKTVIVIDALDECEDKSATSTILNVLARFIPRIAQILHRLLVFIVTSRPEPRVTALFNKSRKESLDGTTTRLLLHMLELDEVKDDIKQCIQHDFEKAAGVFEVEEDWPSEQAKNELAELSNGLFILATTAVRFIMDTKQAGVPQERLRALLQSRAAADTPRDILDVLYTQIAMAASPRTSAGSKSSRGPLQAILGTIALAREPLSSATLGGLVGMSTSDVRNTLIGLHSILHIPDDHEETIRIIHPTFPEFLLATHLEKPEDFCIVAAEQHASFFNRNLVVMKALRRNITGLSSNLLSKGEVSTLMTDVERSIPSHLSYSIRHWTAHLDAVADSPTLAGKDAPFHEFLHHHLLYWLEASSLLGVLEGVATGLNTARIACQKIGGSFATLVPLLADSRCFALAYYDCIDATPLELYHSALGFAPGRSLVKQVYGKELRRAPIARRGLAFDWEPCIKTFSASVNEGATRIDFSPDRSIYVDDKSRICNVTTQKVLTTLDPQTIDVTCATFCPDGQHVAMVSWRRKTTLDVWHLTSGERVHSFEGHSNDIMFVTYSADGRCILSADGEEVRLWSISDRQSLLTLPWDLALPWGIALSPDGAVIALPDPAEDRLCLYSTASQRSERLPLSGRMRTAAFSLDGRYVAASTHTTVIIWTFTDRSPAYSLDVPCLPYRLAFSTDSTQLGIGLQDGSVYLWQIESSDPPVVLRGPTWSVQNVMWSLDDSQIISVSHDQTVRIWDAIRSPVADEQPQLPTNAVSLPDSPRPTVLCNLEGNLYIFHLPGPAPVEPFRTPDDAPTMTLHANIAEAWDAAISTESSRLPDAADLSRGRDWELLTGERHIFPSYSPVILSQDATLMAFRDPSDYKTVRVCNLRTGHAVAALSCRDTVRSTAFSPDNSLLATSSDDRQVRVWDIATHQLVDSHTTHTSSVLAVAFSHGGQLIVSGGADGVVCLYDLANRCTLHRLTFRGSRPWVMKVTFSADDGHVIALDDGSHALIGDVATGAIIHQGSLSTDVWTRTLDFTPDHAGLLVHAKDGRVHKVDMGRTEPHIWPVYHVSDNGWVTEKSPGRRARRVCWLSPEWRGICSLGGSLFWAWDNERRRTVVVDVSEVEGLEVGLSPMTVTDSTS